MIMNIGKIYTNYNAVISMPRGNRISEKIYKVTKDALTYLVNNRYSVTLSCWSYVFIEWIVTANASTSMTDYVYNVQSCRKTLCEYSTNYTTLSGSYLPMYEITCNMSLKEMPYYSFVDCMDDLCRYTSRIGQKFYACTGEVFADNTPQFSYLNVSEPVFHYWRQICPKRHFAHLTKLKQLKYLTRCIEKMCKFNDTISNFGREVLELCNHSPLDKLDEVLHEIHRSVNLLKRDFDENQSLSTTNIITNIAASITSTVSGIATIISVMIMHRLEPQETSATTPQSPSLPRSIANLASSGTQATLSVLGEAVTQFQELLPTSTISALQELSNYVSRSVRDIEEIIEVMESTV